MTARAIQPGDYVLATKYHDGDSGDHFAVGFYAGSSLEGDRFLVVDGKGKPLRANGFRRMRRISKRRGEWLIGRFQEIERDDHSLWWWVRRPMGPKCGKVNANPTKIVAGSKLNHYETLMLKVEIQGLLKNGGRPKEAT